MRYFAVVLACLPFLTIAQSPGHTDFFASIKQYDLSKLWSADSLLSQDDGLKFPFPESLGFIGNNFQRFYIHYLTVRKSETNPYVYDVTGKTRVRNAICRFSGTITIVGAMMNKQSYKPPYKEGSVDAIVRFYEDSTQPGSGSIKGKLISEFCINRKNELQYDAILLAADGYSNNQATTVWKSYKTGVAKICNWGDYRIPGSRGLDVGAGVFYVDEKYIRYGWETYYKANGPHSPEAAKARAIEAREWWKD